MKYSQRVAKGCEKIYQFGLNNLLSSVRHLFSTSISVWTAKIPGDPPEKKMQFFSNLYFTIYYSNGILQQW